MYAGGPSNYASFSNVEVGKRYFCFLQYRNNVNNLSVSGAELLFYDYDGSFLDYHYAAERAYIKVTDSNVVLTVSGANGLAASCYEVFEDI